MARLALSKVVTTVLALPLVWPVWRFAASYENAVVSELGLTTWVSRSPKSPFWLKAGLFVRRCHGVNDGIATRFGYNEWAVIIVQVCWAKADYPSALMYMAVDVPFLSPFCNLSTGTDEHAFVVWKYNRPIFKFI